MSQLRTSNLPLLTEYYQRMVELAQSKNNPLLGDGIDSYSGEPVKWLYPDGTKAPISNFASQQNFLRGLCALTTLTSDDFYLSVAKSVTSYFFTHYVDDNSGLFHWGGHRFVNLDSGNIEGPESKACVHELKHHFPFYDFLYEVAPQKTVRFLKGFWSAHVSNWDKLDLSRHGEYGKDFPDELFSLHQPLPVVDPNMLPALPETVGLTFVNASTDLIYAACHYAKYSGDEKAQIWAKHLYKQFVLARNPDTGMPVYQFSSPKQREPIPEDDRLTYSWFGDRAKRQFGKEFGSIALEANALFRDCWPVVVDNPLAILECAKQLDDTEMAEWVISGIKSYFKYAWNKETNEIIPMWNNGYDLSNYSLLRDGYYGDKGIVLKRKPTDPAYLLPLIRASILSKDAELRELTAEMFEAFGLGSLDLETLRCKEIAGDSQLSSPYLLIALLDLYQFTKDRRLLTLADSIGANLIKDHYHRGFFVETENHQYARLDNPISYALVCLEAAYLDKYDQIPLAISTGGYLHGETLVDGEVKTVFDLDVIYHESKLGQGIGL